MLYIHKDSHSHFCYPLHHSFLNYVFVSVYVIGDGQAFMIFLDIADFSSIISLRHKFSQQTIYFSCNLILLSLPLIVKQFLHILKRRSDGGQVKTLKIPRDNEDENNIMPNTDAGLQFINAYQEGKVITFDAIRPDGRDVANSKSNDGNKYRWPWAQSIEAYALTSSKKSLWRYTVDVSTGQITKRPLLSDTNNNLQLSFGVINPVDAGIKHKYLYANVGGNVQNKEMKIGKQQLSLPPQGIARVDCEDGNIEVWYPHEYEFCGEPMYAPRSLDNEGGNSNIDGEEQNKSKDQDESNSTYDIRVRGGYILSVLYDGRREESDIIVLDADNIALGPIARVPLGISIPHGHFGCFASSSEARWTLEEIGRRARLADKMEGRGNMWNEVKSDFSGLGLRLDDWEDYFGDVL